MVILSQTVQTSGTPMNPPSTLLSDRSVLEYTVHQYDTTGSHKPRHGNYRGKSKEGNSFNYTRDMQYCSTSTWLGTDLSRLADRIKNTYHANSSIASGPTDPSSCFHQLLPPPRTDSLNSRLRSTDGQLNKKF